ncbi:MAG: 5'-nucleotidase C-terminal domain-containing protein, partial [Chloroflexota bacterium]
TLAGKLPPFVIKEVGGEKIGVFGMITDDLPTNSNPGANIKMKDATQTAKDVVADLTKQGVTKIILLSHRGYKADLDLAAKVDGIDLIVGGHTHTLLGDPAKLDKSFSAPAGPYPTVVKSPNGGTTLVVQDFEFARLLGKIDLTFNDKGEVTAYEGQPIFVDSKIADDPEIAKTLADLAKPLNDLKKQVIGKTAVNLVGDTQVVRSQETNLGNLVADAALWSTAWDKTQVAMVNGGGIRRTIQAGDISYGDVLEVLPFGNRLVQFDLTGADVAAALENGISQVYAGGGSGGRFPQVAGLKFSADLSKPVGSRVTDVQIGNAKTGFKPLDKSATYRIVTNDFMANGGDGYAMFKNGKNVNGGDVPIDQALTDYIKFLNAPVAPQVEGRITLTGTPPPAPTAAPTATRTPTAVPSPVVAAPTATPTPTLFPLPTWTPLPIPTFSLEPVLPRLLIPWENRRNAR